MLFMQEGWAPQFRFFRFLAFDAWVHGFVKFGR